MLKCTRLSLGLRAQPKGYALGFVSSNPSLVTPIPAFGSVQELHPLFSELSHREVPPTHLIIVEKHTVLHRLSQSGLVHEFPFLLAVTGKGYPDIDTRRFLAALKATLNIQFLGLCDLNPHGYSLMGTYSYGSIRGAAEGFRYCVPGLIIIGLTVEDIEDEAVRDLINPHLQDFSTADLRCLNSIKQFAQLLGAEELVQQYDRIRQFGYKVELDALEAIQPGYLFDVVLRSKIEILLDL
jgi:meiotic recombination protein SPO11